jgi:hypothetical protein
MIGSFPVSIVVGVLQVATALCILGKQIVLSPVVRNYPNGTGHLRIKLFALGSVLLYFGCETLQLAISGVRYSRPSALVLTAVWALVAQAELEKVLRQWLPERLQRRVQRLWEIASCAEERALRRRREMDAGAVREGVQVPNVPASAVAPALVELQLNGWRAVGPNEPKSALKLD